MNVLTPTRAPAVTMKGSDIVLADKELEAKIMKVVSAEPAKTKSAAMCSQIAAENLNRIRMEEEEGGCNRSAPAPKHVSPRSLASTSRTLSPIHPSISPHLDSAPARSFGPPFTQPTGLG